MVAVGVLVWEMVAVGVLVWEGVLVGVIEEELPVEMVAVGVAWHSTATRVAAPAAPELPPPPPAAKPV